MAGKSSSERAALERQNEAVIAVFERAGFDHIAPDIIQPADIFLERSGEDIRARTFVFTDPSGAEMCLRPDLTVPACRYHLSHAENPAAERRYCYLGPAFRFPDELLSPQEFTQAGLEWFGAGEPIAAEARVLKLTISALEAAGLTRYRVTFGDLGLFSALLEDTDMPARWRQRLKHHFWRPNAFRELLDGFCAGNGARRTSISPLVDRVAGGDALAVVEAEIETRNIPLVGGRELPEIAARLANKAADRRETPLARAKAGCAQRLSRHRGRSFIHRPGLREDRGRCTRFKGAQGLLCKAPVRDGGAGPQPAPLPFRGGLRARARILHGLHLPDRGGHAAWPRRRGGRRAL
jgi:ATP phosphoribosyltransferase regulatory subunit